MLRIIETHFLHLPFVRYSNRADRVVLMVTDEFGTLVPVSNGAVMHSLLS